MASSPAAYDAWYDTNRGAWISGREFRVMMSMMRPIPGEILLDVGCGTGHFSRRFAEEGLKVTGIDPDEASLEFAQNQRSDISYKIGDARQIPYEDGAFDYCSAITSLCFMSKPAKALQEMWRVSRKGVMLGLLNRNSILYGQRSQHPGYVGARWDSNHEVRKWIATLPGQPSKVIIKAAVYLPSANTLARLTEHLVPARLPFGSFLAVYLHK